MNYRAQIQAIRGEYLKGTFTLDEAKARVLPLLDEMNKRGKEIAKENKMPFKPLRFGYVFR